MTASLLRTSSSSWLRRGTVFVILVGMMVFFSIQSDRFLQPVNLRNIVEQNAYIMVASVGVVLTMILGGIDLSIGSVAALVGALTAGLITRNGFALVPALVVGLIGGTLLGAINGVFIVYGKLPPFVVTLAMLGIARGLTLVYTGGRPISGLQETGYRSLAGELDLLVPVPVQVLIAALVVLVAWVLLTRMRFGLHIYSIGGNEDTARLAGVSVKFTKICTYALSGLCAAITGIMLTASLASAQPRVAEGLELNAIAAAVLGGVSLFGGIGGMLGVLAGVLVVGVLSNGTNLLRIAPYSKQIIQGVVLVLAVSIDMYSKRNEKH